MFCVKCGQELTDNAEVCFRCGTYTNNQEFQSESNVVPSFKQPVANDSGKRKKPGCLIAVLVVIFIGTAFLFSLGFWMTLQKNIVDVLPDETLSSESSKSSEISSSPVPKEEVKVEGLREFYNTPKGDGTDIFTIMVYMIGSDLESIDGSATDDLEEMMSANLGDKVNLIVMTGGALSWDNDFVSNETCQYWQIKDGTALPINEDMGMLSMARNSTLKNFVNDTVSAYPADRYGLVMWNHGGGTFSGFGYDEFFPEETMTIEDISDALIDTKVKFDFIGFDACLMGTVETAWALEPVTDYLIASEEIVPGGGWHYTQWLTNVGSNTSIATVDIGKKIVDDFIDSYSLGFLSSQATLSVIETRKAPNAYFVLTDYFANVSNTLQNDGYAQISSVRNTTKEFGDGEMEQIDIVDFVNKMGLDGANEVINAVDSVVTYHRSTSTTKNANGLAMYFPYDYPEYYTEVQRVIQSVGYNSDYSSFFNKFVSAMVGGQNGWNDFIQYEGEYDFSNESWYQENIANKYEEDYDGEDFSLLEIEEKGENYVLHLSDERWDEITNIELQALLDDGEGYLDLGSDNMYSFDEEGDLIVGFNYTWVAIDGNVLPFYTENETCYDDGTFSTFGVIYAYLNGENLVEVIVRWDSENMDGYVDGYRKLNEELKPIGKGSLDFQEGDSLEWVVDYYDYNLYYQESFLLGEPYIITENDITVSYEDVGDYGAYVYFVLTDIYNNVYYTEAVIYE